MLFNEAIAVLDQFCAEVIRGMVYFTQICTCVLEKPVGVFFERFSVIKVICSVVTWPCIVQICFCPSRCYSASFLHEKCNSLSGETFTKCLPSNDPTIHCVLTKNKGLTGEIRVNTFVATKNRSWLINVPFKILISGKFSHSKAPFFSFLSTYKCRKSLSRTTLMLFNWEIMDQTDHANHNRGIKLKQNIRHTCGAVSTRILQEIYSYQMLYCFHW